MIPKNNKLKTNYYKPSQFIEYFNSHQQKYLHTLKKVNYINKINVFSVLYLILLNIV